MTRARILLNIGYNSAPLANHQAFLLRSFALLFLGVGLGIGSTVMVQRCVTPSSPLDGSRADQPPPPKLSTALLLDGEPAMGSPKVPLTIVEFSDFECPYCRRFHSQVLSQRSSST